MDVVFHNFFAVQTHVKDKCPEFFIDWIAGQTLGYHNDEDDDEFRIEIDQVVVGSAGAPRHFPGFLSRVTHDPRRTLFNPFKPLDIPCRLVHHVTLTWQFDVNWYVNGGITWLTWCQALNRVVQHVFTENGITKCFYC